MKSRFAGVKLAFCGAAVLSGGCALHQASTPTAPGSVFRILFLTATRPIYPQQMDTTRFVAQVTDLQGRPVTGAQVTAQLDMPSMDMGRNGITLNEIASQPGDYAGSGRFTMAGQWQVTVQVDKGKLHQAQAFPFTVH